MTFRPSCPAQTSPAPPPGTDGIDDHHRVGSDLNWVVLLVHQHWTDETAPLHRLVLFAGDDLTDTRAKNIAYFLAAAVARGRIAATSSCGRGIACMLTTSPISEAAWLPTSIGNAFTAAASPSIIAERDPLPVSSGPTRVTSAAFLYCVPFSDQTNQSFRFEYS